MLQNFVYWILAKNAKFCFLGGDYGFWAVFFRVWTGSNAEWTLACSSQAGNGSDR